MSFGQPVTSDTPPEAEFDVYNIYDRNGVIEKYSEKVSPGTEDAVHRVSSVQRQLREYLGGYSDLSISDEDECVEKICANKEYCGDIKEVLLNNDEAAPKPRGSFRLSILDLINGENINYNGGYADNWNNGAHSKRKFCIADGVHNNITRYTGDMQECLLQMPYYYDESPQNDRNVCKKEREPVTSILSGYLSQGSRPYATEKLKYMSPKNSYPNENIAERSIITPPPSDLLLTAFKTSSSDSVFSNLRKLVSLEDKQHSYYKDHLLRAYPSKREDNGERYYDPKKSSFDPILALDEVLMLQNIDGSLKDEVSIDTPVRERLSRGCKEGEDFLQGNKDRYSSYYCDNLAESNKSLQKKPDVQYPPETNYDQKSTLMFTERAGNIDRLSIFELSKEPDRKDGKEYLRQPVPSQRKKSLDVSSAAAFCNNFMDRVTNSENRLSPDDESTDKMQSSGVEKLHNRQYQMASADKKAANRQDCLNFDNRNLHSKCKTLWEEDRVSPNKIVTLGHNGVPQMSSSLKVLRDLRRVFGSASEGDDINRKKDRPGGGNVAYVRRHDGASDAWNSEIICNCPKITRDGAKSANAVYRSNGNLNANAFRSQDMPGRAYTLKEKELPKMTKVDFSTRRSRSLCRKTSSRYPICPKYDSPEGSGFQDNTYYIKDMATGANNIHPGFKHKNGNFLSKIAKIKGFFTRIGRNNRGLKVLHRPDCTLARSSSISKDSLPIIPSPRSSSFSTTPFQSILKSKPPSQSQYIMENRRPRGDEYMNDISNYSYSRVGGRSALLPHDTNPIDTLFPSLLQKPPQQKQEETLSYNTHAVHKLPSPTVACDNLMPTWSHPTPKSDAPRAQARLASLRNIKPPQRRNLAPLAVGPPQRRKLPTPATPRDSAHKYPVYYNPRIEDCLMASSVCNNRQQLSKNDRGVNKPTLLMETSAGLDTSNSCGRSQSNHLKNRIGATKEGSYYRGASLNNHSKAMKSRN